jgi:hypothetical protein
MVDDNVTVEEITALADETYKALGLDTVVERIKAMSVTPDPMHNQLARAWLQPLLEDYGDGARETIVNSLATVFETVATRAKAILATVYVSHDGTRFLDSQEQYQKLRNAIIPVLFDHALGVFLARKELILDDDTAGLSFEINKQLADLLNMTDEEKAEYAMVLKGEAV